MSAHNKAWRKQEEVVVQADNSHENSFEFRIEHSEPSRENIERYFSIAFAMLKDVFSEKNLVRLVGPGYRPLEPHEFEDIAYRSSRGPGRTIV